MSDNWKEKAACRGVPISVFYPPEYDEKQGDWKLETALSYCNTCKVKKNCLDASIFGDHGLEPKGVWGGLLPHQRKSIVFKNKKSQNVEREDCGTVKAYAQHLLYKEKTCQLCKDAHAAQQRDRRAQLKGTK